MSGLTPRAAALVDLSAAVAAFPTAPLVPHLERARERSGPRAVEEALLQAHLFVGFPAVLSAFEEWRRVWPHAPSRGTDALPPVASGGAGRDGWRRRGERVCGRVYGSAYGKLRRNVAALHPDLDRWMVEDGYGKVLGRPGLDLRTRELCVVAQLAIRAATPQLHSHLRGALRAGASPNEVAGALDAGLRHVGSGSWAREVRALWERVLAAGEDGEPEETGPDAARAEGPNARGS